MRTGEGKDIIKRRRKKGRKLLTASDKFRKAGKRFPTKK